MKVLLVNLPWNVDGRKGVRAGSRWPHLKIDEEEDYLPFPFFLAYATAILKKNGIDAKGIDGIAEDIAPEDLIARAKEFSPDLVFSEVSTPSLRNDLEMLGTLKKSLRCKIAIAGPDMDIFNEIFMKKNKLIDFALLGEYEFTLLDLVKQLSDSKSAENANNILGLVARAKGKIYINKRRPLEPDINELPWPDRIDFPIYKYHDCPGSIPRPSAQMIASRGCPFLCTFCVWPQLVYGGRNYRVRAIKDIVDEMEFLVREKGFKSIYFDDDTFNIQRNRMIALAEELKRRNWKIPWAFMGRADLSDEEVLIKLRQVGLSAVKYGVESGVQEIVDSVEKSLDLNKVVKNVLITKRLGIKVHLTFTLGLPGETRETIKKTIDFALRLDPESVQFSIMTPFPGTKFYDELKQKGMIASDNFDNYDGNTRSVIRTGTLNPEELAGAQNFAYKRWHDHRLKKSRYRKNNPVKLFIDCLGEHDMAYTLRHAYHYVKNKSYRAYKQLN